MTPGEQRLTSFIRSRGYATLLALCAVAAGVGVIGMEGDRQWWSWTTIALWIVTAMGMVLVNRGFHLLHTGSVTFASLFLALQASSSLTRPDAQVPVGIFVTTVCVGGLAVMYSMYWDSSYTRRLMLLCMLLGALAMINPVFAVLWLTFTFATAVVRALVGRTFLAIVAGLLLPFWIFAGFWPAEFLQLGRETVAGHYLVAGRAAVGTGENAAVIAALVIALGLGALNQVRLFSRNAHTRAQNDVLSLLTLSAAGMCIFDGNSVSLYLPLLNCCAAFQAGRFLRMRLGQRGYIAPLIVSAACLVLYFMSWS